MEQSFERMSIDDPCYRNAVKSISSLVESLGEDAVVAALTLALAPSDQLAWTLETYRGLSDQEKSLLAKGQVPARLL